MTGDIHGAFDLLHATLDAIGFDPTCDRLYCVGDLIDRGDGSAGVVDLLKNPWAHAVSGNHEQFFCALAPNDLRIFARMNYNGLAWAKNLSDDKIEEIQAALSSLPTAMEIPTKAGLVGLVHADIPKGMSWEAFKQAVRSRDLTTIDCALSGRDRIDERDDSGVAGLHRLFVGHTVVWNGPDVLGNVVAIDTGAYLASPFLKDRRTQSRGVLTLCELTGDFATQSMLYYKSPNSKPALHNYKVSLTTPAYTEVESSLPDPNR